VSEPKRFVLLIQRNTEVIHYVLVQQTKWHHATQTDKENKTFLR